MKMIKAYETSDKKRFFDEDDARNHQRRYVYGELVETAVSTRPVLARLDRELLLDFLMTFGSAIGKIAEQSYEPTSFEEFGSLESDLEAVMRKVPRV